MTAPSLSLSLSDARRAWLASQQFGAAKAPLADLVSAQVALAKRRPDYWQRFDAVRAAYAAERQASGGERGGLLRRLFGGG